MDFIPVWTRDNLEVIFFVYGFAFFLMAAVIVWQIIKIRKFKKDFADENRFNKTVFDGMPEEIFVINPDDFKIKKVNKTLLDALKLREEDILGKHCYEVTHCKSSLCEPPDDICPLKETLKISKYSTSEHIHYDSLGNQRYVEVSTLPLFDKKGKIFQVVHLTHDITDRKEIEKKLLDASKEFAVIQSQLVQTEKMASIGQLAGGVAHEINNPLTGVLNNVQLIKMMAGTSQEFNQLELKEMLDVIEESALRCKKITESLLDFSHASMGAFQTVSLNVIIDKITGLIGNEMRLRSIFIQKELQANLPTVQGDPQLLQQVIVNLISNAKWAIEKKFVKSGGLITIKTKIKEDDKCVQVDISDNGVGIPEDKLDKIFEPFFTTKQVGSGTGLGLYIVSNIIRKHRGVIQVESRVNEGATFKISLPAAL